MNGIKFAESGIIEGWAAPYGSPTRRDAQGEWFSPNTDFQLDLIPTGRPLLIGHGLSPEAGPAVVGRITHVERRDAGLWIRGSLDRAGRYFGEIRDQLAAGALAFSSATMAHLRRTGPDGEILRWPLIEVSLTASPSNREARIVSVKHAVEHFAEIGQPPTALKGLFYGPAQEAEAAYRTAGAEVDAIELRRAATEAYRRYTATSAVLDRRLAQLRRR